MMDKSIAVIKLQCFIRCVLARMQVQTLRTQRRRSTRHLRGELDIWSLKCLELVQRIGRGRLDRHTMSKRLVKFTSTLSGRRRSMAAKASHSAPHTKQRWLPLGYNPPKSEEDRQMRLKAVHQQTRVHAAILIQSWWRRQSQQRRADEHTLRVSGLIFINMKVILVQRWWRCVMRQKKFTNPGDYDIRLSAESIVTAEELRIKRDRQAGGLKRLWRQTIMSQRGGASDQAVSQVTTKKSPNAGSVLSASSVFAENNHEESSVLFPDLDPDEALSFMFNPRVAVHLEHIQQQRQKGVGHSVLANKSSGGNANASVNTVSVMQRRLRAARCRDGRFASSMEAAMKLGLPEWNSSKTVGTPLWAAASR